MVHIKFFLILLLSNFLVGCVGTVQDSTLPLTEIAAKPKGSIKFGGIVTANPISQDKIEILFYPASGGTSKFYYTFYVGDKPLPYTFPSEVLTADYRGFLKVTIPGLEPAKTYILKGEAIDQETLDKDSNAVTFPVTTFANLVSDFIGITGVSNTPGIDGIDSINVRWTHARIDYTNITGGAVTDPKRYEIVAVDSDRLTPGDMDKTQFSGPDGRHVKIVDYDPLLNESILRGLKSNTKYFVRVRALHVSSIDDANQPYLRGEKNTNYLTISTLNSSLANVKNLDTLAVSKNPGLAQSTSMLLTWQPITGVYDHLRIYYTRSPNPVSVETGALCVVKAETAVSCRKLPGTSLSTVVANLTAFQTYSVQLVACQNAECSVYKAGQIKTGNTIPTFAGFNGIISVQIATNISEIGKIFLKVPLPDFNEGDFDGYIIGFKTDNGTNYIEVSEMANPPFTISNYNYRTDTTIEITGIDYKVGGLYCFTVYPFVYNEDGTKNSSVNEIWKCNSPVITAPTARQFPGLTDGTVQGFNLMMSWSAPAGGIYEDYEIYLRKIPGTFTFTEATTTTDGGDLSIYSKATVPFYAANYEFSNLSPGTYKVGIISRFIFGSFGTYRSEDNVKLYTCVVDGAMTAGVYDFKQCTPGN